MIAALARRLRNEEGFGLVELVSALAILAVGIMALVAGLSSGYVALDRASTKSTAGALADVQMEKYRALGWTAIGLDPAGGEDSTYTSDAAYSDTSNGQKPGLVTPCGSTDAAACAKTQEPAPNAPDGRTYRLDTYIRLQVVPNTTNRDVKIVTVVVRKDGNVLARVESTFDKCTGITSGSSSC
jgi:type II secretory pathway pseudopilin PulG